MWVAKMRRPSLRAALTGSSPILSAVPVAIGGNVLRVAAIALVAQVFGMDLALRFYHDYNDCLHEDAPHYVLDSTVLRLESGSSVRYHRQFHPTMPLPPYGYFAAFANSQNVDAYISMYMQGYDVFPL